MCTASRVTQHELFPTQWTVGHGKNELFLLEHYIVHTHGDTHLLLIVGTTKLKQLEGNKNRKKIKIKNFKNKNIK